MAFEGKSEAIHHDQPPVTVVETIRGWSKPTWVLEKATHWVKNPAPLILLYRRSEMPTRYMGISQGPA
jgi:hypothetical protein